MIIKELQITAFGKFHKKTLFFNNGINIVYGHNESGKSTVHKFIEAMLFGFFKDQKSRRSYSNEYNKYLPLEESEYKGTMILNKDNNEIRIERNILKGKDSVIIYNNITGEEITKEYYYDKSIKLYSPFDPSLMNRTIYNNTISISQLNNETQSELIYELKDKLVNYGSSNADLSVKNAINYLQELLFQQGTEKRKNTPKYDAISTYTRLLTEKKEVIDINYKIKELQGEIIHFKNDLESLNKDKKDLVDNLLAIESKESKEILEEYNKKICENNKLIQDMEKLQVKDVVREDYQHIIQYENEINIIEKNAKNMVEKINICNEKINNIKDEILSEEDYIVYKNMHEDYNALHILNNEINNLKFKEENNNYFLLEDKVNSLEGRAKINFFVIFISLLLSFFGMFMGIYMDSIFYLFMIFFLVIIITFISNNKTKKRIMMTKEELNIKRNSTNKLEKKIINMKKNINDIYIKYKCSTYEEFIQTYKNYKEKSESCEILYNDLQIINDRRNNLYQDIKNYQQEIELKKQKIYNLLKLNNVSSKDEFERCIKNRGLLKELKTKYNNNKIVMSNIIDPCKLHIIEKKAKDYDMLKSKISNLDREQVKESIQTLEESIKTKESEKSKLEGQIHSIVSLNRNISDIENEILYYSNEIEKINDREKALNLAINTIQRISEEIHNELAPNINNTLGNILYDITKKYNNVRVSKDLEIKIEDPKNDFLLKIGNLSSGTIDQVYFAFRIGLFNFLNYKNMPILLDEAFIQYDNNRLANVLKYLIDNSDNRQIIIFTSQEREITLLKEISNNVNIINLNKEAAFA